MSLAKAIPSKTQWLILLGCVALTAVVAAGNFWVGWQISFTIFYLLPIYIAVANVGRWSGLLLAVASGIIWLINDLRFAQRFEMPGDPNYGYWVCCWNGLALLGFFVIFALAIASLESALEREKSINRNLQSLLTLAPYDQGGWQLPSDDNPQPVSPEGAPRTDS
jgi:hypothetical protein